jgi:hypothetical protein
MRASLVEHHPIAGLVIQLLEKAQDEEKQTMIRSTLSIHVDSL